MQLAALHVHHLWILHLSLCSSFLLKIQVDQYIHRILAEEDANHSEKRNDELFHALDDVGKKLYRKGDFAESQLSDLDVYLLRKVLKLKSCLDFTSISLSMKHDTK